MTDLDGYMTADSFKEVIRIESPDRGDGNLTVHLSVNGSATGDRSDPAPCSCICSARFEMARRPPTQMVRPRRLHGGSSCGTGTFQVGHPVVDGSACPEFVGADGRLTVPSSRSTADPDRPCHHLCVGSRGRAGHSCRFASVT